MTEGDVMSEATIATAKLYLTREEYLYFALRYVEGRSAQEIGARIGCGTDAARKMLIDVGTKLKEMTQGVSG